MVPVFLHINSSAGRYMRKKFCEKYNNIFYVHHINPTLFSLYERGYLLKDKIIRFWRFRDVNIMDKGDTVYKVDNTISVLDLDVKDKKYFTTLRYPVDRYMSEYNRNADKYYPIAYGLSNDIMVKSLLAAFSGDVDDYLRDVTLEQYERLLELLDDTIIGVMGRKESCDEGLNNTFEFETPLSFSDYNGYELKPEVEQKIIDNNEWDMKLYEHFKP